MVAVKQRNTSLKLTEKEKQKLKNHYYNASLAGALGGIKPLAEATQLPLQKVTKWMRQQRTYTLHKPVRKRFPTRRYMVNGSNYQWQADLVEMQHFSRENHGHRYMLTVIDIFSRYAYAKALINKSGPEVAQAFEKIFLDLKSGATLPKFIQTDHGKEFYNQHVQSLFVKYNIEHFSIYSEKKAAIVERFNRTLKDKMYRAFTFQGDHKWLDLLPKLLHNYNNSYHRSIKTTPASITKERDIDLWEQQYKGVSKPTLKETQKFKVGDRVRISKASNIFTRGYLPGWTEEEFIISEVNTKYHPLLYKLRDLTNQDIQGSFYAQELQKVENPENLFTIERIIRTRGKGQKKEAFVKWYGFNEPTWIPHSNIKRL